MILEKLSDLTVSVERQFRVQDGKLEDVRVAGVVLPVLHQQGQDSDCCFSMSGEV